MTLSKLWGKIAFPTICIAVVAGILALAWLAEKFLIKKKQPRLSSARSISFIAMFGAIAFILMFFEFPLVFIAPSFYQLDFSELPVLICAFYLGPVSGVLCEFLKILLNLFITGSDTAFVGELANFLMGCVFILPAAIIYHCKKSKKSAIIGLIAGTIILSVFGSIFNAVYLIPQYAKLYMPMLPLEQALGNIVAAGAAINSNINSVSTLALYCVAPFNLLKGILVSLITLLLYKRVERLLKMK